MTKEFVPYELAVRLKALGFNEPCIGFYNIDLNVLPIINEPYVTTSKDSAPLYQQAFRWFRDKRSCVCEIIRKEEGNHSEFIGWVYIDDRKIDVVSYWDSNTYDEAELACLTKLIEIVEQQNQK